ncbi:thioredoxin [Candidatus Saccharibacteria bacterium]|nr:thioredoxin [Candidatus Saccharibacteria bacterium]NCU40403.1 thioredoxin [Candidatus Saccharibacteria bacterium]
MALKNTVNNEQFEKEVLKNDKFVLVDFWAPWCPPCRMMAPVIEKLAEQKADTLDVVKVDIEESLDNKNLAIKYGVQGIPNMQVFKDGKVVKEIVGMRPANILAQDLSSLGI